MKKILPLFLIVVSLTAITSCKRCFECVRYPNANDTEKLCRGDYASDDSYNDAYRQLTAQGYRCN